MPMSNPTIFINDYLSEMVPRYLSAQGSTDTNFFNNAMRLFPTSPTLIDTLTKTAGGNDINDISGEIFAVYDRMFKLRRGAFPHCKCEQLLYYFYKILQTDADNTVMAEMMETAQAVYDLMDRGDESAEELNAWIKTKLVNGIYTKGDAEFYPIYFHETKVFQLEEVRDIIDFGTARTFAGNKIIIDYEYHYSVDFNPIPSEFDTNNPAI